MQSMNFEPVCVEFQQNIRNFFKWDLKEDEEVLKWLEKRIVENSIEWNEVLRQEYLEELFLKIKSNKEFIVLGANVTNEEIMNISKNTSLIVADGAIGALISINKKLMNNVICLISDGDGVPHIINKEIEGMMILLHAHGHAKENLEYALNTWEKWIKKPKIILTHQTPKLLKNVHNFGGFTDGDRCVCLLHSLGVSRKNITLLGFNSQKMGQWSGLSNSKLKFEKLKWMKKILNSLGYNI